MKYDKHDIGRKNKTLCTMNKLNISKSLRKFVGGFN